MESENLNQNNNTKKFKEERIYVKSNKGKKIELKNLETIKLIEESGELDQWTQSELGKIKNFTFKNNIFDCEEKKIVSSVRLLKTSKLGRTVKPMVWEYYKNRGNLDINQIIKQYGRSNLVINYSVHPSQRTKKSLDETLKIENLEKVNQVEQIDEYNQN